MPDDLDLLAAIGDDPPGERIAAALADCDQVGELHLTDPDHTHDPDCWMVHTACWAARIRRHLTGEDHPQ